MQNKTPYSWMLALLLCALLVLPVVALAADDTTDDTPAAEVTAEAEAVDTAHAVTTTTSAADDGPQGVGILMLLIGMGGVVAVGATMIGRASYKDNDSSS